MPYTRVDPDAFDTWLEHIGPDDLPPDAHLHRPTGGFEYETAEARFTAGKLNEIGRAVLEALVSRGATAFRGRYDGGHDEGFAHADQICFGDQCRSAEDVAKELSVTSLVDALRPAHAKAIHYLDHKPGDLTVAKDILDLFADELVSRLVGKGYGTGEYDLYGGFHRRPVHRPDHRRPRRPNARRIPLTPRKEEPCRLSVDTKIRTMVRRRLRTNTKRPGPRWTSTASVK